MDPNNDSGQMPAVGGTDEEVARELSRHQRVDVYLVLSFLGAAAAIAAVLVWLMNQ